MANQPHTIPSAGPITGLGIINASPEGRRSFPAQGVPLIHRVNWLGLWTLYMKEVRRFFKVQTQTIWAPAITTLLFLVIFTVAMGRGNRVVLGVNFATFVAPGLIVMGMMQNSFANSSFSFLSGKMQGTIIDYLMPPLSTSELMAALIGAALTRAVLVGLALALAMYVGSLELWPGLSLAMAHPWAVVWFGFNGAALLALVGLLSSIWADKFDQAAAVSNFVIQPLSLLSGTFYVVNNLSPAFQAFSRANPFFYVISGFRFGFLGRSDIGATNQAVLHGALGLGLLNALLALGCYRIMKSGWKLKS